MAIRADVWQIDITEAAVPKQTSHVAYYPSARITPSRINAFSMFCESKIR
jgi:hypothetical protein